MENSSLFSDRDGSTNRLGVQELSESIALARLEKAELENFLQTSERFSHTGMRTGRLPSTRFSAYNALIMENFGQARKRFQPHIDEIEAYIQELTGYHNVHTAASLACRLPFEVLGTIFTTCVLMDIGQENETLFDPLTLASVCSIWRNVALRTPSVWSKIAIYVAGLQVKRRRSNVRGIRCIEHGRAWIQRSGSLPLYLRIYWGPSGTGVDQREQWADLIASLSHRLAHFDLSGNGGVPRTEFATIFRNPFPRLVTFKLLAGVEEYNQRFHSQDLAMIKIRGLHRLRTVIYNSGQIGQYGDHDIEAELDSLEALSIQSRGHMFILPALAVWLTQSTRASLQYLSVDCIHGNVGLARTLSGLIELPNLLELSTWSTELCSALPKTFSLPALTTLRIKRSATWNIDIATPLLKQSNFPHLKIFELRGEAVDALLQFFLRAHPQLTSLCLGYPEYIPETMTELGQYPREPGRVPLCLRLEIIEIGDELDQHQTKNERFLDPIISSRYTNAHPESYSDEERRLVSLVSLKWYGKEMLPHPIAV